MRYSDEFIEETLRENVNLRLQYFEAKERRKNAEERLWNYKRTISKEARNKNKYQVLRERDILQQRIDKAIEYIYANCFDETKKQYVDDLWGEEINNLLDILRDDKE